MTLEARFRALEASGKLELPVPGNGATAYRLRKLATIARSDLALARMAEAHVDAMAILAEAHHTLAAGLYGVWASETTHLPMHFEGCGESLSLTGTKMFCTGAGIVDRALITVNGALVDVDVRDHCNSITIDHRAWKSAAFAETQTAAVTFYRTPVREADIVGDNNWYILRPGFWHGACCPAACWAGGAMGLYDYALAQARDDSHTLAHLAAMSADVWAMWAYLEQAGSQIDSDPDDPHAALVRALTLRHLIEEAASDILRRLGRAYGPRPLAYDDVVATRYQELELYIRQSHAERDLEQLGREIKTSVQLLQPA